MAHNRPRFESWGRYPSLPADLLPLYWSTDFPPKLLPPNPMLPVGAGRSYGDVCLLDQGTLLPVRGLDRLLHFDPEAGVLKCEAGVTLEEILDFAVPRGFFLSVAPGTKYVTVGGAIANDVHGKNHHKVGTFGCHLLRFELTRSDGTCMVCSPTENQEWFSATIGGLGLTGLITWAEIRLRPIVSRKILCRSAKFTGVEEFVALSQSSTDVEYTVAWLDCIARGRNFARGIFKQGGHADEPEKLVRTKAPQRTFPFNLPDYAMNNLSIGMFNAIYYNKQTRKWKIDQIDYEPFFFPLDGILKWNRIYGKSGLLQFQCIIPWEQGPQSGILRILEAITDSGLASFLAVMKVFGDVASPGLLSFPKPGITLALDFPIRDQVSFALLDRLANITLEHGGRMYPAKDARMKAEHFQTFYPQWRRFARYVDPRFSSAFWQRVTSLD